MTRSVGPLRCFSRHLANVVPTNARPDARPGVLKIAQGPGGRSSVSGHTVTVFGCTGFVGRYVVNRFGRIGSQIVTPWRGDEDSKRHLKVMGDLGQIAPMHFDIYNTKEIADCVRYSDIVINLIGRDYATKNFSFANANIDSARTIAHVCREEGVPTYIQMSHLSANEKSPSQYLKTKALGEEAAREEFPDATIVRCATIYGHEDRFLHMIGWLSNFPSLPVPNNGDTIRRPICVSDVATALMHIATDHTARGKTYELYGPKAYTLDEVVDLWLELTRKPKTKMYPPKWFTKNYAKFVDAISPYPKINPDLIERLYIDEHPQLSRSARTLADAGVVKPHVLDYTALEYVRRYRKHDDFHLPGRVPPPGEFKAL